MKKEFGRTWNASKQPRKQRKYSANAPLHVKGTLLGVHLSKLLREKYKTRSIRVRVGDKVKILRGSHRGIENKVERVDLRCSRVFVSKVDSIRKDGTKHMAPLHPSNLIITELNVEDKKRKARLERGGKA